MHPERHRQQPGPQPPRRRPAIDPEERWTLTETIIDMRWTLADVPPADLADD